MGTSQVGAGQPMWYPCGTELPSPGPWRIGICGAGGPAPEVEVQGEGPREAAERKEEAPGRIMVALSIWGESRVCQNAS